MKKILINCDMGEGTGNDASLMPFIHAANIACGYHAGDVKTMNDTIELCARNQVLIGAHPSYFDKKNFGRSEMQMDHGELYDIVIQQILILSEMAGVYDQTLNHVKPHGALYNQSAKDPLIARTIARAVFDFDHRLILFGLSGSHSVTEAEGLGLKTSNEIFADRVYEDDGSLRSRSKPGAMIVSAEKAVEQVLLMVNDGAVISISGTRVPVKADTVCIHGDGEHALDFAKALWQHLQ
jgi:UPF0271 protein